MAKVVTLSRQFPSYHPKAGQETHFVENAWSSLSPILGEQAIMCENFPKEYAEWLFDWDYSKKKHHTVRLGRRWKDGDMASLRVWSGKPYASPQISICQDVKLRVVDIIINYDDNTIEVPYDDMSPPCILIFNMSAINLHCFQLATNDDLLVQDFLDWFQVGKKKGVVEAQILI
jgi:hypothetical protein